MPRIGPLVARGRVHCDSYAGLRVLLVPASKRASTSSRRRRHALFGIQDAGRWALVRQPHAGPDAKKSPEAIEHVARTLLRRYGVVCWRMLEREAAWLPPWRELVRVYHRLEARGEIRGGRFIVGLSGEQFALPEALGSLRQVRRRPADGQWVRVSAADPANLLGTVLAGAKIPRVPGSSVVYRDGIAIAASAGGQTQWLVELDAQEQRQATDALVQRSVWKPSSSSAETTA